ncbi:MAG: trypsin-like peptidase domain-containing protein [Gemmataceae bacterium]
MQRLLENRPLVITGLAVSGLLALTFLGTGVYLIASLFSPPPAIVQTAPPVTPEPPPPSPQENPPSAMPPSAPIQPPSPPPVPMMPMPIIPRPEATATASVNHTLSSGALSGDKIYKQLLKSTALILQFNGSQFGGLGSGVLIDAKNRLVLTNDHVIADGGHFVVLFPRFDARGELLIELRDYPPKSGCLAKVVARSPRQDLAIVQLESLPTGVVPIRLAPRSASPGQAVYAVGCSGLLDVDRNGALWRFTSGTVRQLVMKRYGESFHARVLENQMPVNSGDSGGPNVNDRAQLVAVTCSGRRDRRLVSSSVDITEIREFISKFFQEQGQKWVEETGELVDASDLPTILSHLDNADPASSGRAFQALRELGPTVLPTAIPALMKCAASSNPVNREQAMTLLREIRFSADQLPVLRTALGSPQEDVALFAADKVRSLGKAAATVSPELVTCFDSPFPRVRQKALEALTQIGPDSEKVFTPLLKLLSRSEGSEGELAVEALTHLPVLDEEQLQQVAKLFREGELSSRLRAAFVLLRHGEKGPASIRPTYQAACKAVLQAVRGGSPVERQLATRHLMRIPPAGLAVFEADDRKAMLQALVGLLRQRISLEEKKEALLRIPACKIDDLDTIDALRKLIEDPASELQCEAITAMARMPGRDATAALASLAPLLAQRSTSNEVKLALLTSLESLGQGAEPAAPQVIHLFTDKTLGPQAIKTLAAMGEQAVPHLKRWMNNPNDTIRMACLEVVILLGPDARGCMAELLFRRRDRSPEVRALADRAYNRVQDPRR